MRLLVSEDTTTPSYWLNWRFLLCAIWVLTSILFASFLIWKYERSDNSKSERGEMRQERPRILCYDESWKPCLKEIHPLSLVVFRLIAFCLLLVSLSFNVAAHGGELFYYYTQWTFTLITIYFEFGFLLSVNGCLQHHRPNSSNDYYVSEVAEQGLYEPLAHGVNENGVKLRKQLECPEEHHCSQTAGLCGYLFQILFQISAGAVTLTDGLYWTIIFPFLTIRDYELSFLTFVAHSLNAILLLGDTALNSLGSLGTGSLSSFCGRLLMSSSNGLFMHLYQFGGRTQSLICHLIMLLYGIWWWHYCISRVMVSLYYWLR